MKPQEILEFYEELCSKPGWNSLDAIRVFLPQLFATHSFDGFHFFTSHAALCISHFASYEDRKHAPLFTIVPHAAQLLRFEFVVYHPEDSVIRIFTEHVICPIDRGLEQFDDIFSRFRIAKNHNDRNA